MKLFLYSVNFADVFGFCYYYSVCLPVILLSIEAKVQFVCLLLQCVKLFFNSTTLKGLKIKILKSRDVQC